MVRMSKEVKKGLRREAMKSIRVAFQIMDESTSLEILERRYRVLCGKIYMCGDLGVIDYDYQMLMIDLAVDHLVNFKVNLSPFNKEVA